MMRDFAAGPRRAVGDESVKEAAGGSGRDGSRAGLGLAAPRTLVGIIHLEEGGTKLSIVEGGFTHRAAGSFWPMYT